jgi:thymidylate kinase
MWNPICFVGIDGSGKTTLAREVIKDLRKQKVRSNYVWFRAPYFFSFPFLAFCRVVGLSRVRHKGNLAWTDHYFTASAVRLAWVTLQFLDAWLFSLIRIRLPMAFGYVVICDRTIYDILVDLMIDTGDSEIINKPAGQLLLQLIPSSAGIFILDVDEWTAFRRKRDIPDLDYLRGRLHLYERLAKLFNLQMLQNAERDDIDRVLHHIFQQ